MAIAGPEGLRETAAAGYADLAVREPASADMVSPWFSMTKIVTASLAMRLADRGVLNLDQSVLPLVPEFVEHLGGGAGFFNLIRIYPAQAVGIAIMGNATKYPIDAVARLALTRT